MEFYIDHNKSDWFWTSGQPLRIYGRNLYGKEKVQRIITEPLEIREILFRNKFLATELIHSILNFNQKRYKYWMLRPSDII